MPTPPLVRPIDTVTPLTVDSAFNEMQKPVSTLDSHMAGTTANGATKHDDTHITITTLTEATVPTQAPANQHIYNDGTYKALSDLLGAFGGTGFIAKSAEATAAMTYKAMVDLLKAHSHADANTGGKLAQANTHESADTDAAATSLHHTIGVGAFQAAAGNHTHDTRYILLSQIGAASGVAGLDATSLVPLANLPVADVPRGGTGLATIPAGRLLVGAGTGAMTALAGSADGQIATWGAAGNGGTGGWIAASLGAANIGDGSLPWSKMAEGYISLGAAMQVVVAAGKLFAPDGTPVAWAQTTLTLTAPTTVGNKRIILIYVTTGGVVSADVSAEGVTPAYPLVPPSAVGLGYATVKQGDTAIVLKKDYTNQAATGYVEDWRSAWYLAGAAVASAPASGWAVTQGGTGATTASAARANLVAAQSGANTDIATMDGIQRIKGLYFATTNSIGLNQNPSANDWLAIATNNNAKRGINVTATGTGGTAVANNILVQANGYYDALDSTTTESNLGNTPYGVGMFGFGTYLTIGNQVADGTAAAAWGSVIGYQSTLRVRNVGHKDNEFCQYGGILYNDNGNMTAGTPMGRLWGLDINVHGAIGQTQSGLSNAHFTLGNYANGSPFGPSVTTATFDATDDGTTRNASTGVAVTAAGFNFISNNIGIYYNQPTFPNDIGVWIGGVTGDATSGTSARQGWRYGIVIGSRAGNYGEVIPGSRIGTGVFVRDYETAAIRMWNRYAGSTAMGLIGNANSGPSVFGMQATTFSSIQFRGFLNVGDRPSDGTNWSDFFNVNGGALASVVNSTRRLAAFSVVDPLANPATGVAPVDTASLLVHAIRNTAAGNTYTTTSIGLGLAGPNTAMLNGLWFAGNGNIGLGLSATAPSVPFDVGVSTTFRSNVAIAGHVLSTTNGNPADVIATGGTIPNTYDIHHINPAAAVTGLIIDKTGVTDGQRLTVVNVSVNTATMAAAATSNVASGTGCVVPALGIKQFVYNAQGGFWYSN